MRLKRTAAVILTLALASSIFDIAAAAAETETGEISETIFEEIFEEAESESTEQINEISEETTEEATPEISRETTETEAAEEALEEAADKEVSEETSENITETETAESETQASSEEETADEFGEQSAAPELSEEIYLTESQNIDMAEVTYSDSGAAISSNLNYQNYSVLSKPVYSYLIDNEDNTFTRVEYISGTIVVEDYSNEDYSLTETRRIEPELSIFGGFYAGENYNFFVFGQTNYDEDDSVEVIRIVRYTKNWERVDSCSLYGENTCTPFSSGSLRMAESGDMLYIRTCHTMYESSDGKHHQANLTIFMQISTMTVTWKFSTVISMVGYVSHSFNQFIITDNETIIALDHGDAYPRAAVLTRYDGVTAGDTSTLTTYLDPSRIYVLKFLGETGANATGASLGGLEASSSSYLTALNSVDQSSEDTYNTSSTRNIYITGTPKDNFTANATTVNQITNYSSDEDVSVSTPHLVKIDDNCFMLMWNVDKSKLNYILTDGSGNSISEVYSSDMLLSDCKPFVYDNKVIWYYTNKSTPVFCSIDVNSIERTVYTDSETGLIYRIKDGEASVIGYEGSSAEVVIPESLNGCPVTSLSESAFYKSDITKISISDGVLEIGKNAFYGCSSLRNITLPESIISIGDYAFYGCTALTDIEIPKGVNSIESYSFCGCSSLGSITLPESMTSIGDYAFYGCSSAENITFPKNMTSIGTYAFYGCTAVTDIEIPEGVSIIESYSFCGCSSLKSISFPESLTEISRSAFSECSSLKNIIFSVGLTLIDDFAFYSCSSLESIEIPDGVTYIGTGAIAFCESLTDAKISNSVISLESCAFQGCSSLKTAVLSQRLTSIESYLFSGCTNLESIEIPGGVTSMDYSAFDGCTSLKSVVLPNGLTSIASRVFYNCSVLSEITLPESLTSIGERVFYHCESLTDITIPKKVTTINKNTFAYCYNLKTVTFGRKISEIDSTAFNRCKSLETVYCYEGTAADDLLIYPTAVNLVYLVFTLETGDVNDDGDINVLDLVAIFDHIQGTTLLEGDYLEAADINEDADVNVLDLSALFDQIQG